MSDLDPKTTPEAQQSLTFGAWLKNQRLAKKVPLEEIAAVTKIHISQLRSLEEGWEGAMPAPTFIRGFVVSYVRHLGLNEAEVLERFRNHSGEFKERSQMAKTPSPTTYNANSGKPLRFGSYSERKDQLELSHWVSTKRSLYAVLVVIAIVLVVFLIRLGKKATSEEAATPAPATVIGAEVNNPQPLQTKVVDQTATAQPGALFAGTPPFDFTMLSTGDCWINLKVDDNSLESFKLAAGQTRKVTFNRRAKVTLSNSSLIKFQVSDATYKIASADGGAQTFSLPEQASKLSAVAPKAAH